MAQPDGPDDLSGSQSWWSPARLWKREAPRQAGILFSAQSGSIAAGFLASVVLARWMDPGEMGRLALCLSVIWIASLFFELGVSSAGARLLALTDGGEESRRQLGALIAMGGAIGLAYSLFIAAIAIPLDRVLHTEVRWLLIQAAPLAFFQPFQSFIEQACQGLNQIRRLSIFQLLMSWSYVLMVVALALAGQLTAQTALVAYLSGMGLATLWTLAQFRPRFAETQRYIRLTLNEVWSYGLNIYVARITASASVRVDSLLISYFLGRSAAGLAPLGLYAIAQKMANPIITMSRAVAITRFRAFANVNMVPERISRWNAVLLITASTGLAVIGPFVLRLAFPRYGDAAPLLIPFAVWGLFAGLFQPYNAFLASHGRGAELRNIALCVTTASVLGLILTVPRFGIMGAACSGAGAMALDYLLHIYYYRRFTGTLNRDPASLCEAQPDEP